MSYLVLARKHRPLNFAQVVGQEHITRTLTSALELGRVAHALCFTGPRGVGKTSVARIMAKALNCEQGPTAQPCGVCQPCREIEEGRAVDVQEIDAASNSRVEDVRELREIIRYRPQSARYRVTILDEVHMLSKAAFNALLKTLEEPPEHAVFILATTDVHKVPLTILSRCQRHDFRRLPPRLLAEHLSQVLALENRRLPQQSINLMAREADGSTRDALSLLDQILSLDSDDLSHEQVMALLGLVDRHLVSRTAQAVLQGQAGQVLDLVSQVYAAGAEMQNFYGALQEHFRNLAAAKAAPAGLELFGLTKEETAALSQQAQAYSPETLHEIFDQLARSEELFRRASQPRLVMEMALLKLTQIKPVLSLDDIIARLDEAQSKLPPPKEPALKPPAPADLQQPAYAGAAEPDQPAVREPLSAPEPPGQTKAPAGFLPDLPAAKALAQLIQYAGRASEILLATALNRSRAAYEDNQLVITIDNFSFATAENQERLNSLAAELWPSARPRIKLKPGSKPAPAAAGPLARPDQDLVRALSEHPLVQEALEIFEAEIVDVRAQK